MATIEGRCVYFFALSHLPMACSWLGSVPRAGPNGVIEGRAWLGLVRVSAGCAADSRAGRRTSHATVSLVT